MTENRTHYVWPLGFFSLLTVSLCRDLRDLGRVLENIQVCGIEDEKFSTEKLEKTNHKKLNKQTNKQNQQTTRKQTKTNIKKSKNKTKITPKKKKKQPTNEANQRRRSKLS